MIEILKEPVPQVERCAYLIPSYRGLYATAVKICLKLERVHLPPTGEFTQGNVGSLESVDRLRQHDPVWMSVDGIGTHHLREIIAGDERLDYALADLHANPQFLHGVTVMLRSANPFEDLVGVDQDRMEAGTVRIHTDPTELPI